MTHDPWEDKRTTTHWTFCDNELYRAYNLLSEYDRENLLWEIDDELKQHDDKWDRSTEVTNYLVSRKLVHMQTWRLFFKLVK